MRVAGVTINQSEVPREIEPTINAATTITSNTNMEAL